MLVIIMIAPSLSGCAANGGGAAGTELPDTVTDSPATVTEAVTDDPAYTADLPELTFPGQTFTFLVQHDPCFRHLYDVDAEEDSSDIVISSVYRRNAAIKDKYGVTITAVKDGAAPAKAKNAFKLAKLTLTDRQHKYLMCPSCGKLMRIPRGQGDIVVSCPGCGHQTRTRS